MAVGMAATARALRLRSGGRAGAGCIPSRQARPAATFRRDCDRIIHSTAFRRLKHKTQVFVFHEGDHYRTRLTHYARGRADRPLARPRARPRRGPRPRRWRWRTTSAIRRSAMPASARSTRCLGDFGGFDHNAQTLRVVTTLERRYAAFDGLNLTWETLEGLVKHNGPLTDADGPAARRAIASTACRWRSPPTRSSTISSCGASPARRRRSRPRRRHRL